MVEKCCVKKCRRESGVVYMGRGVCDFHWEKICELEQKTGLRIAQVILGG